MKRFFFPKGRALELSAEFGGRIAKLFWHESVLGDDSSKVGGRALGGARTSGVGEIHIVHAKSLP